MKSYYTKLKQAIISGNLSQIKEAISQDSVTVQIWKTVEVLPNGSEICRCDQTGEKMAKAELKMKKGYVTLNINPDITGQVQAYEKR